MWTWNRTSIVGEGDADVGRGHVDPDFVGCVGPYRVGSALAIYYVVVCRIFWSGGDLSVWV